MAGLQGFASALILRVWNCLEMRPGVGPGSPDVVSGALATEVPKCTRFLETLLSWLVFTLNN